MKKAISILLTLFLTSFGVIAQDKNTSEVNPLKDYEVMVGEWIGEGWIMTGRERIKKRFKQREVLQMKADGKAIMIDGLGHGIDESGNVTDRVIHDAFGIVSYNAEMDHVTMLSFTEKTGRMEVELVRLEERKFQWSMPQTESGGTIRFTDDLTEEGKWNEVGEFSMDGQTWYPFFKMTLTKQ